MSQERIALVPALDYWRRRLGGLGPLELPVDHPRPPVQTFRGATVTANLPAELQQAGGSLFATLAAAFQVLLARYARQQEVAVGVPFTGRNHPDLAGEAGPLTNQLVLRTDLSDNPTFRDLLARVEQGWAEACAHGDIPFATLLDALEVPRDGSQNPLVQAWFELREAEDLPVTTTRHDLALVVNRRSQGLRATFIYNADLFASATIERMAVHFQTLLKGILAAPSLRIADLPLLPAAERDWLLGSLSQGPAMAVPAVCLHELIEARAAAMPEATALVAGTERLTYAELNRRANQLAHYLRSLGIGPGKLVGIYLRRTAELPVALLATLKAGGAYVPLDPAYPSERAGVTLEEARVAVLLTQAELKEQVPAHGAQVICVEEVPQGLPPANLPPQAKAEDLAYVLYTSGSTGRPKGVALEHRNAVNFAYWAREVFSDRDFGGMLAATSICFDLSVFELFVPLCWGGKVILAENALHLANLPAADEVTLINTVPSAMAELVRMDAVPASVRTVNLAGEPLQRSLVDQIYRNERIEAVYNLYGPTETTTYSTFTLVPRGTADAPTVGRPVLNTQVYVLDEQRRPVPAGVPGELYIGGGGVARGYLGQPGLTAERFLDDPFLPGNRMYRTGDLVRFLSDGNLQYMGRLDFQVKIRGFRIELGEIETVLDKHPGVRHAVVTAREAAPGDKRLVAYVVAEPAAAPTVEELRTYLRAKLPEYMVPAAFVLMEALPLTPNGKVDRKRLPAPSLDTAEHAAPTTPVEELVAGIWQEILGLERVGAEEAFFDLGGHSLLATRVLSRMRQILGVELTLPQFFAGPTVRALAAAVERQRAGAAAVEPIRTLPRGRPLPLSFAQHRLWFLEQMAPGSQVFTMVDGFRVQGALRVEALQGALHALVQRHETLRTTILLQEDGIPVQLVAETGELPLRSIDLTGEPEESREDRALELATEEARRPFDLTRGPLVRCLLLKLGPAEHLLVLTMHHIISDGWSMGVFFRELGALYAGESLPDLPVQYADFGVWQREWLQGDTLAKQLAYWEQQLAGNLPVLELPADRTRPAVQSYKGALHWFTLPRELAEALRALSRREGATLFMTLLAAYSVLLSRYARQEEVLVGTPIANRTRSEVEGLVGFFVNTLVMRTDLTGAPSFGELLRRVRDTALNAYANQELPVEQIVEALHPERNLSYSPLFQVMFAMQNAAEAVTALGDLALERVPVDPGAARVDLLLDVQETEQGLDCFFEYATDLFDAGTVERMAVHFRTLLEGIVAAPALRVTDLPLMPEAEQAHLLDVLSQGPGAAVPAVCLHELIEARAAAMPDATALIAGHERLSYAELNQRANRLAHYLRSLGVGPGKLVGIYLRRTAGLPVALLATLKAGGAYVPLDPAYPSERAGITLEEARVAVLLTQADLKEQVPAHGAQVVCLEEVPEGLPLANLTPQAKAEDLAYVLYTSGSTGRPKGVALEHRNAVNFACWARAVFSEGDFSGLLAATSICFDLSVFELFVPLCWGGTVILADNALHLADLPAAGEVTLVNTVPSAMAELVRLEAVPASVRTVNLAGEPLQRSLVDQIYRYEQIERVYNLYGPTETTTYSTFTLVPRGTAEAPTVGRPVLNTQVYVLDEQLRPVPPGVPGELYIGGEGVARGYLNQPALTAERFLDDPFLPGNRIYRTGDLVRFLRAGDLQYLGRLDFQVKIRGFRIELGEIEAVLDKHPGVRQAVVAAREVAPGDKRLVAYVVVEPDLSLEQLRTYLKAKLPEYMVPAAFVAMEALPLTPNGKVDRKRLPAPELDTQQPATEYVAPTNATEEQVAAIFAAVLHLERVSIHDNFFDLGGHSLLVMQVLARIQKAMQVRLPVQAMFEHPTVAGLAAVVTPLEPVRQRRGAEELRALLDRLDELSAEEQEALLRELGEDGGLN